MASSGEHDYRRRRDGDLDPAAQRNARDYDPQGYGADEYSSQAADAAAHPYARRAPAARYGEPADRSYGQGQYHQDDYDNFDRPGGDMTAGDPYARPARSNADAAPRPGYEAPYDPYGRPDPYARYQQQDAGSYGAESDGPNFDQPLYDQQSAAVGLSRETNLRADDRRGGYAEPQFDQGPATAGADPYARSYDRSQQGHQGYADDDDARGGQAADPGGWQDEQGWPDDGGGSTGHQPHHPGAHTAELRASHDPHAYGDHSHHRGRNDGWGRTEPEFTSPAETYDDDVSPHSAGADQYRTRRDRVTFDTAFEPQVANGNFDRAYEADSSLEDGGYDQVEEPGTRAGRAARQQPNHADRFDDGHYAQDRYDRFAAPQPEHGFDQEAGFDQGLEQGFDEYGYQDEYAAQSAEEPEPRRKGGFLMIAAGALAAAVVVGGGLGVAYNSFVAGGDDSAPKRVSAVATPTKSAPEQAGGKVFPNQGKQVYQRFDGSQGGTTTSQTGTSGQHSAGTSGITVVGGQPAQPGISIATSRQVVSGQATENGGAAAPMRVPTIVVRPGEKITAQAPAFQIAGNQGANGSGATGNRLPAAGGSDNSGSSGSIAGLTLSTPSAIPAPTGGANAVRVPIPEAAPPKSADVEPALRAAAPINTAVNTNRATQVSSQPAAPASNAATNDGIGGYVVQVLSSKTRLEALAAFADIKRRFDAPLRGKEHDIQEADLGTRGTWYRLRIGPPSSRESASALCAQLKTSGLRDCLVSKY